MSRPPLVCIAHRGASGYRPENTLAAFHKAIEMGCEWVELDVYSVEGELLVIHDDTLERTTNGTGEVQGRELAYLRSLDAGDGQQIPLLREVIDAIDKRAVINIELKCKGTAAPVVELLRHYLAHGWTREMFLISSFDHDELARVAAIDATLRLGLLYGRDATGAVESCRALNAYSLNLGLRVAEASLIEEAHRAGLAVFVYTANSKEQIRAMHALGADGVFTNYPDRVFELMQEMQDGN